jgi:hypothetical protein
MKNLRTLISTVMLLAAVSICAQSQERPIAQADVPFPFTVENTNLPAGAYTISVLPPSHIIKVQSADTGKSVIIPALPAETLQGAGQGKLVFRRFGNLYFLTQVWESGNKTHRDVQSGKLANELAKHDGQPQTLTILATTKTTH